MVDPHFTNAFAHRFHIARIAQRQAQYSRLNAGAGTIIAQIREPKIKFV